jgi:hypothetical protein
MPERSVPFDLSYWIDKDPQNQSDRERRRLLSTYSGDEASDRSDESIHAFCSLLELMSS